MSLRDVLARSREVVVTMAESPNIKTSGVLLLDFP
jgi:hypothetical protein